MVLKEDRIFWPDIVNLELWQWIRAPLSQKAIFIRSGVFSFFLGPRFFDAARGAHFSAATLRNEPTPTDFLTHSTCAHLAFAILRSESTPTDFLTHRTCAHFTANELIDAYRFFGKQHMR